MIKSYTNIPQSDVKSLDSTVRSFNSYFSTPVELHAGTLAAMTGFFTNRGFDQSAAQAIAVIIITQSQKDNLNPMQVLDTLKGYDNVEVSAFVSTIINFNRYKTSFIGYSYGFAPKDEVARNILA
jgi:hypothetical protein